MTVRLQRDRTAGDGHYVTPDGRFAVWRFTARRMLADRWMVHDRHDRARWPDRLIPEGSSSTVVLGLAAARALIAEQIEREQRLADSPERS